MVAAAAAGARGAAPLFRPGRIRGMEATLRNDPGSQRRMAGHAHVDHSGDKRIALLIAILALFLALQRYIVGGLTAGSVKG